MNQRRDLLQESLSAIERLQSRLKEYESGGTEPIAIVGAGCRYPGGVDNLDSLWRLLKEGVDAIEEVPADRWKLEDYYDPDPAAPGKATTRWGGFLQGIDRFDAHFFGISPREAASLDPQQRLLLEVSQEALENAAIPVDSLSGSATGVFIGITTSDYGTHIGVGRGGAADIYAATGTALNAAAGRIAFNFGLQGPCVAVDTACSSSLSAVHLACQSLRTRESDLVLAGGVNVMLLPELVVLMSKWGTMAADGRCKTFDAAADGFVRSEGCAVVALKRLSDALADGSPILGLIRGSAINSDGRSSGLTVPNGLAQQQVLRKALKNSGLSGGDIDYVEAHGTGTALGDPIEVESLTAVFCEARPADRPLRVGSIKTNIGHAESAAGIAGLLKAIAALRAEAIPRHLHFSTPSPAIDWGSSGIEVPATHLAWPRGARVRRAGVSSFGFSGTNAHVILEEAPPASASDSDKGPNAQLISGSARTEAAARELAGDYLRFLSANPGIRLADFSRTASVGRATYPHRFAFAASSREEAARSLERCAAEGTGPAISRVAAGARTKVGFMFSGQGSQYGGMALELARQEPVMRQALEECAGALEGSLDIGLMDLLGRADLLDDTCYTQPALFAVEWALSRFWRSAGVEPAALIGHSIGEYVAACVAGVMDVRDGAKLIAARGRLMKEKAPRGAMLAVLADIGTVEQAIRTHAPGLVIAAFNAADSIVVSGHETQIAALLEELEARSIRAQRLAVSHAFHSPLLEPMLDDFAKVASGISFREPSLPIYSNLTGELAGGEIATADYWVRHAREPVRFAAGLAALRASGVDTLLEVGPGSTLSGLARRAEPRSAESCIASLRRDVPEAYSVAQAAAQLWKTGAPLDLARFQAHRGGRLIGLPTYPFQRERYWLDAAARPNASTTQPVDRAPPGTAPDWFYRIEWQLAVPSGVSDATTPQSWLILNDRSGTGESLAQHIRSFGDPCIVETNLHAVTAHLERGVTHVVHCLGLEVDGAERAGGAALLEAQRKSCGSLLDLVQAAARFGSIQPPRISVVTRGAVTTSSSQLKRSIAAAPLVGLVRTIALEHPHFSCRMIDLDPDSNSFIESTAGLLGALLASDDETVVALRGRSGESNIPDRYAARLVRDDGAHKRIPAAHSSHGTYLITGGLGGLGLKMGQALVESGARHLVLLGRSAPSPEAHRAIERMTSSGAEVRIESTDVSDEPAMRALFESLSQGEAPLAGIVHAAGVLDDGVMVQQDWDRFERVLRPKIQGTWNLHTLSSGLPLQFFVLFSSVSGVLGSPAQSNYAAANAFLDAVAEERRSRGLPGLSIAWGAWASGMADNRETARRARLQGISLMDPAVAVRAFLTLLSADRACVGVMDIDWSRFAAHAAADRVPPILAHLASLPGATISAIEPLPARLAKVTSSAEREPAAVRFVSECIAAVLGLRPDDVAPDESLVRIGLDSLMALEVRNRLESGGAGTVPIARLLDGSDALTVARVILGAATGDSPQMDIDEAAILDQIASMSEAEIEEQLALLQKDDQS